MGSRNQWRNFLSFREGVKCFYTWEWCVIKMGTEEHDMNEGGVEAQGLVDERDTSRDLTMGRD
jgi:hypothetical protein